MQKWIMAVLFFGACTFGLVLLIVTSAQPKPEAEPEPQIAAPAVTLDKVAAETVYKQSCLSCHGDQLQGKIGPNLQKAGTKFTEQQLYKLILNGKGGMPAFKSSLKEEEIANLSLWLAEHK
ncbi:cytochrome c [Paenibacillus sp. GYB004]|uniref:c-type cytochrome n=1 Tax=Paenibacillus sp. GYB004 TaxID=2994393 RepID=UPI002F96DC90